MPDEKQGTISAQVVMRPGSGRTVEPSEITAANIREFQPDARDAAEVRQFFEQADFETSPLVGISFAITAPKSRFEKFFGAKLESDARGVHRGSVDSPDYELPVSRLPGAVRDKIAAVTFTPPPDFGPTSFGP
jgi:hypothetical protein